MPKSPKNEDNVKQNKEIRELKKRIKRLKEEKSSMKRAISRRDKQLSKMTLPDPVDEFIEPLEQEDDDSGRMQCPDCGKMAEVVQVGIFEFCKCEKCGYFKKIVNKKE